MYIVTYIIPKKICLFSLYFVFLQFQNTYMIMKKLLIATLLVLMSNWAMCQMITSSEHVVEGNDYMSMSIIKTGHTAEDPIFLMLDVDLLYAVDIDTARVLYIKTPGATINLYNQDPIKRKRLQHNDEGAYEYHLIYKITPQDFDRIWSQRGVSSVVLEDDDLVRHTLDINASHFFSALMDCEREALHTDRRVEEVSAPAEEPSSLRARLAQAIQESAPAANPNLTLSNDLYLQSEICMDRAMLFSLSGYPVAVGLAGFGALSYMRANNNNTSSPIAKPAVAAGAVIGAAAVVGSVVEVVKAIRLKKDARSLLQRR